MGRLANKISLAAWIGLSTLGSLMGEQAFPASGGVSLQELEAAVAARDLALDEEWRALPDRAAFERKCAGLKQAFREAVGFDSIRRTPLNAKSMGVKDHVAFRIEKVMIESAPGEFVPLLVFLPVEDFFPIEGSRSTYRLVKEVAEKVGLPDGGFELSEAPGKHCMSKVHRERAIRFLLKHLNGEEVNVVETETTEFSNADITVTPDGEVSHLAGFRPVYDDIADKFSGLGVTVEQAAANAKRLVLDEMSGVDCRGLLATLKGDVEKGRRTVLKIGGTADSGEATATLFADGVRHVVRGHRNGKVSYYERRNDDEVVAVDLYLAGRSLVALRAAELLTLAAELKHRTGFAPELVAEGRYVTVAKFAVAADAAAFASVKWQNEPKPFLESLKAREYLSFADSGAIYSGIMSTGDGSCSRPKH